MRRLLPLADVLLVVPTALAAWLLRGVRLVGIHRLLATRQTLLRVGVFPLRNHYYDPQFDNRAPRRPFTAERPLPGINWNIDEQLHQLTALTFAAELADLPRTPSSTLDFFLDNEAFVAGDAEYWYQLLRASKPRRIFEIGSGHSTRMAIRALARYRLDDEGYQCRHVCIEPYEMPWLEQTGVEVIRSKVETLDVAFFGEVEAGDLLFTDSSHIIRPQGDVLSEYLELLPTLRSGVLVHVHDIFSPRDYLESWLMKGVKFWNEQYLLEPFLTHNSNWKIVGALNWLHHHYDALKRVALFLSLRSELGSMYVPRVR